jgi:K+-sensing histidine kinase KdpD
MRENFVSALSHDLRTPLTVARSASELIFRDVENIRDHT